MIVSLVGMTVFEIVAKMLKGKFIKKIFFTSEKAIYLPNCEIDKLNSDESRIY